MSYLTAVGITVGILAGVWCYIADMSGLAGFVGFLGWATYFAAGGGKNGAVSGLASNLSGVVWGIVTTLICGSFPGVPYYFFTIIFAAIMCWQARFQLLSFIPGTFIGNAAYYAAAAVGYRITADPMTGAALTAAGLACGILLGLLSDVSAQSISRSEETSG